MIHPSDGEEVSVQHTDRPRGSARLELVEGVRLLHPEDAVFEAMLRGWARQQQARRLQPETVRARENVVRGFFQFADVYPWVWTAALVDEWSADLTGARGMSVSTVRNYQQALRLFTEYLISPFYDWPGVCQEQFGTHPTRCCHEWNTTAHLTDYEADPRRRPFTREELQRFFDYADDQVDLATHHGRKGALAAYRDATLFKVIYGWGLRRTESTQLDIADWHRNPHAPELGTFGMLEVRYGKRIKGSAPRRRTVASLVPWAVTAVEDYLVNIRPRFGMAEHPALWVTERGTRLQPREITGRFEQYRAALTLPPELTTHSLRHAFVTHQIEDGTDPKLVQELVGHRWASSTAIYTAVSGDFMNTMMRKALDRVLDPNQELA
jgi:integrase/recombinase XerC